MSAELWLARVDAAEAPAWRAAFEPLLSGDERARLGRFVRPLRRVQFLAAHALVRGAVAARMGCRAEAVQIAHESDGRPRIDQPSGLRVSLAHSGAWAAALVDSQTADASVVGLDIEVRRADRDIESIVRALGAQPRSRDDAYRYWVLYEAAQKAAGNEKAAGNGAGWAADWAVDAGAHAAEDGADDGDDLALAVVGTGQPPTVWRVDLGGPAMRMGAPAPIAVAWTAVTWTERSFERAFG